MQIGCGCVNIGSASSGASARDHVRLVRGAYDAGVRVFDTADVYGRGESERIVGRALRDVRDDVVISTKGGYQFRPRSRVEQAARRAAARARSRADRGGASRGQPTTSVGYDPAKDFDPDRLRAALEASLQRLGTDHVDVYHLHGPPKVVDGLLVELEDLRSSGKVRRFGIGAESVAAAAAWVATGEPDVVQLPLGVLDPDGAAVVDRAPPGTATWARGALGGGVLAAAMRDVPELGDHPKRPRVEELMTISEQAGMRLDELALRWVAGCAGVETVLVGMSSPPHLSRNVALAAMGPLPVDVRQAVDGAVATGEEARP